MKKLILSWGVTLLLLLLGVTQSAQAQCKASNDCFDFTFNGAQQTTNGNVKLTFTVKTNCQFDLSNVAFELPAGVKALNPKGTKYNYGVENTTNNPFYSVKFEARNANGYKNGAEDVFSFEIPFAKYSGMTTIRIQAKAGQRVGKVAIDITKCNPGGDNGDGDNGGGDNGNGDGDNGGGNNGDDEGDDDGNVTGNCKDSQPSPISGPYDPCPGEIVTYCIEKNPKYTSYVWDVPRAHAGNEPTGWVILSGQGTNCVTVRVGEKPGTMKVKVTHAECGTKVRTKPVHPGKKIEVNITGPTAFCPNDKLTYTADAGKANPGNGNGGNDKWFSYAWTVPADWTIVSGQGTKQIVVIAGQTKGDITVKVESTKGNDKDTSENGGNTNGNPNNGNGNTGNNQAGGGKFCGPATAKITPERKPDCGGNTCPTGAPTVNLVAPDSVCNLSDNTYFFRVEQVQAGVDYQFELPEGFVVVNEGEGFVEVVPVFEEDQLGQPQTIRVIATNECGTASDTETVIVVECSPGNPLPVAMKTFDGVSRNGAVELTWTTASEINNDRFEIERSTNGTDFVKIGQVKGNGNSTVEIDYAFTDRNASAGTVYYRLRQVDLDGSFEHSKMITVKHNASANAAARVSVFPNPATNGNVNIRFSELPQGNANVRLVDMTGKVVMTKTINGDGTLEFGSLGLAQGVYMISITSGGTTETQRLVIR
ncbi:T9SS type A sorting domain-containing protein [Rufibacter sp. LB8]|uniref:T9SS type A sorting domain-containing protein n=1 Tax=Rufibacter sp. LB8 TaxID=2777781 RepID=UPI00178C6E63|nr:T9SS type A sorting domain-containing protein [Rufibacter sp. LB8]